MSALGQKQTYAVHKGMSALLPKANMCTAVADVRFRLKADMCGATRNVRFDAETIWPHRPYVERIMIIRLVETLLGRKTNMQGKVALRSLLSVAVFFGVAALNSVAAAPYLIVGNDEKLLWDDKGAPVVQPAGKDSVVILDLANPQNPKMVAPLPLKNSVVGPPVNLASDQTN